MKEKKYFLNLLVYAPNLPLHMLLTTLFFKLAEATEDSAKENLSMLLMKTTNYPFIMGP